MLAAVYFIFLASDMPGEEVIYMTRAPSSDSAIAYIEKSENAPTSLRGASDIFSELESYSFD